MHTDLEKLRDRCRGAFIGTAIGDALGVPMETMHRDQIIKIWKGKPFTNYVGRKTGMRGRGRWSDDTQLSVAIARALIRKHGLDWDTIAEEHVRQLCIGPRGWGRSTRSAVLRLMTGIDVNDSGTPEGAGNGVVMKLAPMAIFHVLTNERVKLENSEILARMTHDDSRAVSSAHVHLALLVFILKNGYIPENFWDTAIDVAKKAETKLEPTEEFFSDALIKAKGFSVDGDPLGLWENIPPTCYVLNSLPFTYGMFYMHGRKFEDLMTQTIYAGGDTDSNASIAAAMWGGLHGYSQIPKQYKKGLEGHNELITIADMLFDSFYQGSIIAQKDVKRLSKKYFSAPKKRDPKLLSDMQYSLPFISSTGEISEEDQTTAEMAVADLFTQLPEPSDYEGTVNASALDWAEQVQAADSEGVFDVYQSPEGEQMVELMEKILSTFENEEIDGSTEISTAEDVEEGLNGTDVLAQVAEAEDKTIFDDDNVISLDAGENGDPDEILYGDNKS